ncbi:MAG: winged helix-turn-helix domain-containing protein [Micropepsaceae bacterium]
MSDAATDPVLLAHAAPFRLGALHVRPATREVSTGDWRDVLEPRVMQVLVALARAAGEVVGRDELTQSCWDGRVVSEDAINRVIARLRRLAEQGEGAWFTLETVTKVGYRLVPGMEAAAASSQPEPASAPQPLPPPAQRARRWPLLTGLAALAAAALIAIALLVRTAATPDEAITADYLRAEEAMNIGTAEESAHAIALMQSVVERAPDYAAGWSGLALAYLLGIEFVPPEAREAVSQRANAAWQRALELDADDPGAHVARYFSLPYPDLATRDRAQLDVLARAPNHRNILLSRAGFLRQVGRTREALDFTRRGAALDAQSPRTRAALGRMLVSTGNIEEADRVLAEAARLWPRNTSIYFTRVWVYLETKRPIQAQAMLDDRAQWPAGVPVEDFAVYRTAAIAFQTRKPEDVKAALDAFAGSVPLGFGYAQNAMMVQSALGDLDAAFRTADALYLGEGQEIAPMVFSQAQGQYAGYRRGAMHILFSDLTAAMRDDPRFDALIAELGIVKYWRETKITPDVCLAEKPPAFCARALGGP